MQDIQKLLQEAQEVSKKKNTQTVELKGVDYAKIKGDKGDKGEKGDKGDRGEKGDKGDMPTIDYNRLENAVVSQIKPIKGDKGDKGDKGEDFTPNLEELAINTINTLETYKGDDRLDASAIKNLEKNIDVKKLDLKALKTTLGHTQHLFKDKGWASLFWSNHDQPRAVSRYGNPKEPYRKDSAKMLFTLLFAMKGTPYIYQGEEFGMTGIEMNIHEYRDIETKNIYQELKAKAVEHKALKGYKAKVILRWNDSGDFFTKKYVDIAESVMKRLEAEGYNVESYAYTKMGDVANTSDIQTTFSKGANKRETAKIDPTKKKVSDVVAKELFKGLDLMKIDDEKVLKDRVAKHFNLDPSNVITYDELMQTPKSDVPKWAVIVTPENGDDAAFRKDVKMVLLTQH
jgi:hypothetical protein